MAKSLADGPTFGHGMTKTMLYQEWSQGLDECIEAEAQAQAICMQTQDFERAYKAFASQADACIRGQLMADKTFLAWPFFDDGHRKLAGELERGRANAAPTPASEAPKIAWMPSTLASAGSWPNSARSGLLRVCVPRAYGGERENLDVRSLCLAREIMGRASGLADFALAMQGLGSAPITLYGREDQKRSISAACGGRHGARRLCAFGTGRRLGRERDFHDRHARRQVLASRRSQDLDFERRPRRLLRCLCAHGRRTWNQRPVRVHRRCRQPGPRRQSSALT